jgi:predicted short-subunit dehydrogenase-like oxidoreductase (DUF2520 family)
LERWREILKPRWQNRLPKKINWNPHPVKFQNIAIIGAGRVGSNLARRFFENGFSIICLIDSDLARAQRLAGEVKCTCVSAQVADLPLVAEIILITTADNSIELVSRQISQLPLEFTHKILLHCSGALTSRALGAVRQKGAAVASMHPVQTFLPVELGLTNLAGVFWGLEGDPTARSTVRAIVKLFGGQCFEIPADKKELYHAACVVAGNYLIALEQMSALLFNQFGINAEQSSKILAPLREATFINIQQTGSETALTGPIARGDWVTVEKHLEVIKNHVPVILQAYIELGQIVLRLCETSQKLEAATIFKFRQLFRKYSIP